MRVFLAAILGACAGIAISSAVVDVVNQANARNSVTHSDRELQWVDRTHKGNRLEMPAARTTKERSPPQKLLIGCEAAAGTNSALAGIPARCIS